jgi:glucose/arabinose dehydrogenase
MIDVAIKRGLVPLVLSSAILLIDSGTASAQLRLVTIASGLNLPVGLVGDPLSGQLQYVLEQGGVIRLVLNDSLVPTPFLNISSLVGCCGEQGLLGLAFAPDYPTSGRFFVNYTNKAGNTVVARFLRSADDYFVADPASRFELRWGGPSGQRFIAQPYANHNGGHIAFGPDGDLYIGLGDGGAANDPENRAQNPQSFLGKILRIDVNVPDSDPNGYVIPLDNPFPPGNALGALAEIWAFGLRNPWKFSFDSPAMGGTGAMFIGDVGQNTWEEVDYQPPGLGGLNYGWRIREGAHTNPNVLVGGNLAPAYLPLTDPILEYPHPEGASVTGGVVYRGRAMHPSQRGRYFFGDLNGRVWSVALLPASGGGVTPTDKIEHTAELGGTSRTGLLSAIGADSAGEVYFLNYTAGTVMRLVDAAAHPAPRRSTDFYGEQSQFDHAPDLVWFNQATGQLAAWHMGASPLGSRLIAGGALVSPVLPPGWRVAGTSSETSHNTNVFLQSDDGLLGVWVFRDRDLQYGITLNPGRVSDPLWRVRAVGDFNHDGHVDLVWQYAPTGQLAFWFLNGINAIGYAVPSVSPGPDWEVFGTGDSNFDDETDLYWQHRTRGTLAVWRMVGTEYAAGIVLSDSPSDAGWRAVGTVDLDLEAGPDILFQHATTGTLAAWYLERETVRFGVVLNPSNAGDPNWKLVGPR